MTTSVPADALARGVACATGGVAGTGTF